MQSDENRPSTVRFWTRGKLLDVDEMCHRDSVLLSFLCRFITWHVSLPYSLCLYVVSLNLQEWVGCVSISNLSVYSASKGLKRQSVNSWCWMGGFGGLLCAGEMTNFPHIFKTYLICLTCFFYSHDSNIHLSINAQLNLNISEYVDTRLFHMTNHVIFRKDNKQLNRKTWQQGTISTSVCFDHVHF